MQTIPPPKTCSFPVAAAVTETLASSAAALSFSSSSFTDFSPREMIASAGSVASSTAPAVATATAAAAATTEELGEPPDDEGGGDTFQGVTGSPQRSDPPVPGQRLTDGKRGSHAVEVDSPVSAHDVDVDVDVETELTPPMLDGIVRASKRRQSESADAGHRQRAEDLARHSEELMPRDDESPSIPAAVVLRHRMGYSNVVLTRHQRKRFTQQDLDNYILYKKQKYNAINVLWRFNSLMLLVMTFAVFCLVFSTGTTDWLSVNYGNTFISLGLFVACREQQLRTCVKRQSAWLEWTVVDRATGETLCHASAAFVHRYVGALWAMGILQLSCELAALLLSIRIALRPTRTGALGLLLLILFLSMCSGLVTIVLFPYYTACLRRTCAGVAPTSGTACEVQYRFGYKLYIGAVAVHTLLLALGFSMHSYIHNIRVNSRQQLRSARHLRPDDVQSGDYVVRMLDALRVERGSGGSGSGGGGGSGPGDVKGNRSDSSLVAVRPPHSSVQRGTGAASTPELLREGSPGASVDEAIEPSPATHSQPKPTPGAHPPRRRTVRQGGVDSAAETALPDAEQISPGQHSVLHVSFADAPHLSDAFNPDDRAGSSCPRRHRLLGPSFTITATKDNDPYRCRGGQRGGLPRDFDNRRSNGTMLTRASGGAGRQLSPPVQAPRQRETEGAERDDESSPRPSPRRTSSFVMQMTPQNAAVDPLGGGVRLLRRPGDTQEAEGRGRSGQRRRKLLRFFNRSYDANYLTAAELGVRIAGATDWVYDDRSDLYYSFQRHMFWDPLTEEYYNCALKSWQESPDQVIEVRDAISDMWTSSSNSGNSGDDARDGRIFGGEDGSRVGDALVLPSAVSHFSSSSSSSSSSDTTSSRSHLPETRQHHGEPVTPTTVLPHFTS